MTMGSELRLTAWTSDEAVAGSAFSEVFAEFDRLDNLMGVWREGSAIQRLDDEGGGGAGWGRRSTAPKPSPARSASNPTSSSWTSACPRWTASKRPGASPATLA